MPEQDPVMPDRITSGEVRPAKPAEQARAGETSGRMRYVLLVSLVLVIVAMLIAYWVS